VLATLTHPAVSQAYQCQHSFKYKKKMWWNIQIVKINLGHTSQEV
jgi:hypothetical protein